MSVNADNTPKRPKSTPRPTMACTLKGDTAVLPSNASYIEPSSFKGLVLRQIISENNDHPKDSAISTASFAVLVSDTYRRNKTEWKKLNYIDALEHNVGVIAAECGFTMEEWCLSRAFTIKPPKENEKLIKPTVEFRKIDYAVQDGLKNGKTKFKCLFHRIKAVLNDIFKKSGITLTDEQLEHQARLVHRRLSNSCRYYNMAYAAVKEVVLPLIKETNVAHDNTCKWIRELSAGTRQRTKFIEILYLLGLVYQAANGNIAESCGCGS